jgi:hypothetical protein
LAWLQLWREFGNKKIIQRIDEKKFTAFFDSYDFVSSVSHKPAIFVVLLALARITESKKIISVLNKCLIDDVHQFNKKRTFLVKFKNAVDLKPLTMRETYIDNSLLVALPFSAFSDLKWLADTTDEPEIKKAISSLLHHELRPYYD